MTFGGELSADGARRVMDRAADLGIYFFDTAAIYPFPVRPETHGRAEEIMGGWLRGKRDSFVVATKCGNAVGLGPNARGGSRKHVIRSCEDSLRRLQTDRVDVYYVHDVHSQLTDSLDETLEALDRLVRDGKVLYVGLSNCSAWQLALAMELTADRGLVRVSVLQNRYNLVHRTDERDVLPLTRAAGIGMVQYNPLGGGILTGELKRHDGPSGRYLLPPYRERYWNDEVFNVADVVADVARAEHCTPAQVAIGWMLAQSSGTVALTGALVPEHLDDNVRALDRTLSEESLRRLTVASQGFR